jgi:hypothetical protein
MTDMNLGNGDYVFIGVATRGTPVEDSEGRVTDVQKHDTHLYVHRPFMHYCGAVVAGEDYESHERFHAELCTHG